MSKSPVDASVESFFAVTAPGLEAIAADELRALGAGEVVPEPGGVGFRGTRETLYLANLHLRTVSRVLVRIAAFHADSFYELERRAKRVPWEKVANGQRPVRFRITCHKSRLFHSGGIAERLTAAVENHLGVRGLTAGKASEEEEEGVDAQLFVVRLVRDEVTISVDSSGALLHRRGYRQAVSRAPVRETLAAAMLLASGWDRRVPLLDPMCGSGTIGIEAALLARQVAPGLATGAPRHFAFADWPDFDAALWERLVAEARSRELPTSPALIQASDRDAGAVAAARSNAERARVTSDVAISQCRLISVVLPQQAGWLLANPPYGVRVGERAALRELYASIGKVVRGGAGGWRLGLLMPANPMLERELGLRMEERLTTRNGGISVQFLVGGGKG